MKKVFLCAAMAVLALVGCEKQTQTSLDFEDVQKEAKITGKLGFWYAEPGGKTEFVALKGQRIWFRVDANKYDGNVTAGESYKVFETVTSSVDSIAGNFEIVVPVGNKQINGDLMTDVIKINHNGKMFYFDALNGGAGENLDLLANDCKVKQVDVNKNNILSECVGEGTIIGKFTRNAGTAKVGAIEEDGNVPAAGFTVVAHVKYDKKVSGDAALVKKYVATTQNDGTYKFTIPAYDNGNDVEIEVKQKEADYREFVSNKWVTTQYYYAYAKAAAAGKLQINETLNEGTHALTKGAAIDKSTMEDIKNLKVSGTLYREIEELDADKDGHSKGVKAAPGKEALGNVEVTIELANGTVGKSLYYKTVTDAKGNYELENIAIYDGWDIADVTIKVYVNQILPWIYEKSVKNSGFKHYYLGYEEKDGYYIAKHDQWYYSAKVGDITAGDKAQEQMISGTYNDKEDLGGGVMGWRNVSMNASLFFEHKMDDLILQFKPENEKEVYGLGGAIDTQDVVQWKDRSTGTTTSTKLYSDGGKVW